MVYGIGADFIEISRIREIMFRSGDRFARRILSKSELIIYERTRRPLNFLAKRFAAKEAVSKAFGTGVCRGLFFRDIEIFHDDSGKPKIRLFSYAKDLFNELALSSMHITLSDDQCYVFAIVIFE